MPLVPLTVWVTSIVPELVRMEFLLYIPILFAPTVITAFVSFTVFPAFDRNIANFLSFSVAELERVISESLSRIIFPPALSSIYIPIPFFPLTFIAPEPWFTSTVSFTAKAVLLWAYIPIGWVFEEVSPFPCIVTLSPSVVIEASAA